MLRLYRFSYISSPFYRVLQFRSMCVSIFTCSRLSISDCMIPEWCYLTFRYTVFHSIPLNSADKSRSREEKIFFAYKSIFRIVSSRIASNYFNFNRTVLESTKNRYSIAPIIEFHKISYKKFRYMEHLLRTRITSISHTIRRWTMIGKHVPKPVG